ncbi:unnamed protein product, partial [Didymodactylos carnosus]
QYFSIAHLISTIQLDNDDIVASQLFIRWFDNIQLFPNLKKLVLIETDFWPNVLCELLKEFELYHDHLCELEIIFHRFELNYLHTIEQIVINEISFDKMTFKCLYNVDYHQTYDHNLYRLLNANDTVLVNVVQLTISLQDYSEFVSLLLTLPNIEYLNVTFYLAHLVCKTISSSLYARLNVQYLKRLQMKNIHFSNIIMLLENASTIANQIEWLTLLNVFDDKTSSSGEYSIC